MDFKLRKMENIKSMILIRHGVHRCMPSCVCKTLINVTTLRGWWSSYTKISHSVVYLIYFLSDATRWLFITLRDLKVIFVHDWINLYIKMRMNVKMEGGRQRRRKYFKWEFEREVVKGIQKWIFIWSFQDI